MDKEDVVHIYKGTSHSHKKERNWVICRYVDGSRDYLQSEVSLKGKNKYCVLTHVYGIWKNSYRQSYLLSRNRDTDVENKSKDTKGEGEGMGWIGRLELTCIYHWYYV